MQVGNVQFGRPQLTKSDLDDMEKAIEHGRNTAIYNTISITNCNGEVSSVQIHWDSDIYDYMERIQRLLIADGFHSETVRNGFRYMVHEHYDTEQANGQATDEVDGYDAEMKHLIRWISENCNEMDMLTKSAEDIFNRYLYRNAPSGVCKDCGEKYGDKVDEGCTWWRGLCTWCGDFKELADELDFGYPKKGSN